MHYVCSDGFVAGALRAFRYIFTRYHLSSFSHTIIYDDTSSIPGRFQFVILNKKGDGVDYWEDVGEGFSCEKQEPYVMYKKESSIVGIWFYEEVECGRFSELFEEIGSGKRMVGAGMMSPAGSSANSGGGGGGGVGGGGQALLGLLRGPGGLGAPPQGPPGGMTITNMGLQGPPPPVDNRVRMLLENLSRNEGFCRMLGEEMRRVGL